MEKLYLLTGATGHLGQAILKQLLDMKKNVRVLLLKGESLPCEKGVEIYYGNVIDANSMMKFFLNPKEQDLVVIHAAGRISISSKEEKLVYETNVTGTKNIVNLSERSKVIKLVYVSSVHAIPEIPHNGVISEVGRFYPNKVEGFYAKTKAEATQYVMDATVRGLDASVVHPSGIIGPYDNAKGNLVKLVCDYYNKKIPIGVEGGYDFVDVRDVAQGVIAATENGKKGECYILSSKYYTIKELFNIIDDVKGEKQDIGYMPSWLAKLIAPAAELYYNIKKQPPLFTKYSIHTLTQKTEFSNERAKKVLDYSPRDIKTTIKDTVEWLSKSKLIK